MKIKILFEDNKDIQNITTYDNKMMTVYVLLVDDVPHAIYTDIIKASEKTRELSAAYGTDRVRCQENALTYND